MLLTLMYFPRILEIFTGIFDKYANAKHLSWLEENQAGLFCQIYFTDEGWANEIRLMKQFCEAVKLSMSLPHSANPKPPFFLAPVIHIDFLIFLYIVLGKKVNTFSSIHPQTCSITGQAFLPLPSPSNYFSFDKGIQFNTHPHLRMNRLVSSCVVQSLRSREGVRCS